MNRPSSLPFLFLFLSTFLILPTISNADVPSKPRKWYSAFQVTNANRFNDYSFFFTYESKTLPIKSGKTYAFTHSDNAHPGMDISLFAVKKSTRDTTVSVTIGNYNTKEIITIQEIRNDSIIYTNQQDTYRKGENDILVTNPDDDGNNNYSAPFSFSAITTIMISISIIGLFIFGSTIIFRKRIQTLS